ncbi:MAG: ABC transporter permease [Gemmatimonadetes bacterium]|jgi:ABC-2 type transport system permease protein|nr:ABC transporter permease [Gemmatimonadota bacterium]MBT6143921.1 ABC transporter permease [Gemmatimonadota bacterium]MBT7860740.1 ABC transporter permease [Gemmatimonadota bacterium]
MSGAYRAILEAQMRSLLQYRAAAIGGALTQIFFGFVIIQVYEAFYAEATGDQPMALQQVITYVWLGQAMLGLFPWNVDPTIRQQIRDGNVVYELLRPVDLYGLWFARSAARRLAPTMLRSVPILIVAAAFLGLQPPATWAALGAWIITTFGAILLATSITALLTTTMLWTISGEGIVTLAVVVVVLTSGMAIPLPLMPLNLQAIMTWLPFRGLVDIPFRLYLGHLPVDQTLSLFGFQILWAGFFILAGRTLLSRLRRRIVVQGG